METTNLEHDGRYLNTLGVLTQITANYGSAAYPYTDGTFFYTASGSLFESKPDQNDLDESLSTRIYRILRNWTLGGLTDAETSQPYPLVDAVSDPAPCTIESGETRLWDLAEALASDIFLDRETARTRHPIEEDNT